jgi:hypothetical protein
VVRFTIRSYASHNLELNIRMLELNRCAVGSATKAFPGWVRPTTRHRDRHGHIPGESSSFLLAT